MDYFLLQGLASATLKTMYWAQSGWARAPTDNGKTGQPVPRSMSGRICITIHKPDIHRSFILSSKDTMATSAGWSSIRWKANFMSPVKTLAYGCACLISTESAVQNLILNYQREIFHSWIVFRLLVE